MYSAVTCTHCKNDIMGELLERKPLTACPKCGAPFDPRDVRSTQFWARFHMTWLYALISGVIMGLTYTSWWSGVSSIDDTTVIVGSITAALVICGSFLAYQFHGHWVSHMGCGLLSLIGTAACLAISFTAFGYTWLIYGGIGFGVLFGIALVVEFVRPRRD